VHDIADLERRGVVGVFVASTEFVAAAAAQSRALAEAAVEEIVRAVTDEGTNGS
jgi:hypothetical protein